MFSFRLTPRAENDLKKIGRYTQKQWGKKQRDKYLDQLDNRFSWLADNFKLGKKRNDIKKGYYCCPEGKHIIFYRIKKGCIEIIGILHKNMDVKKHI